jgi:ribosomal protein S27E
MRNGAGACGLTGGSRAEAACGDCGMPQGGDSGEARDPAGEPLSLRARRHFTSSRWRPRRSRFAHSPARSRRAVRARSSATRTDRVSTSARGDFRAKTACHQQHVGYMMMSIPKAPTHCTRCQGALADTVIIVAQLVPNRDKKPHERAYWTRLLHVCEQCATQQELDAAKTQVICPGCSRTLFVPYQWNGHRRRYCCEACGKRARRKANRMKTHLCPVCKVEFQSARRDARFCSDACRQSTYRLRKAAL